MNERERAGVIKNLKCVFFFVAPCGPFDEITPLHPFSSAQ